MTSIDRLPPHATESEQGVLGCILLSPVECLTQCISLFRDGVSVFYDLRHAKIYESMLAMQAEMIPIDVITLHQRLKDRQLLEQIGGIPYLNSLQDIAISAANLSYYAATVHEKYLLRKLLYACTDIATRVYDHQGDVRVLIDEAEKEILSIGQRKESKITDIKTLVQHSINRIEETYKRQGKIGGISTGLPDLDYYLDGLNNGELIVPAAFPGFGKTSLLMNFIEHAVLHQKLAAAVFSLEMTGEQLVTRFLCSHARVNLKRIGEGHMVEADFPKLTAAAGKTNNSKLYIVEDCETIGQIRAEARRLKQQHNIALIGVDYLQLVQSDRRNSENRQQEVADVCSGLKRMAKELRVPVVAPSQLNDDGKLRESRAIGQDADVIMMLERDGDHSDEEADGIKLWIRKNRNGPRDVCVNLTFLKGYTRFESAAKVDDEDIPPRIQYKD